MSDSRKGKKPLVAERRYPKKAAAPKKKAATKKAAAKNPASATPQRKGNAPGPGVRPTAAYRAGGYRLALEGIVYLD